MQYNHKILEGVTLTHLSENGPIWLYCIHHRSRVLTTKDPVQNKTLVPPKHVQALHPRNLRY